jgi:hypothetical protein
MVMEFRCRGYEIESDVFVGELREPSSARDHSRFSGLTT